MRSLGISGGSKLGSSTISEIINSKNKSIISNPCKKQCVGKSKYSSKYTANIAAKEHSDASGNIKHAYYCKVCGFYHVGRAWNQPKTPRGG